MANPGTDIQLPSLTGLLACDYDFTFDYGGSVIKVIYKKKSPSGEEALFLRSLSGGDHDALFELVSGLGDQAGRELTVTGVGCKMFSSELQKGLNVKFNVVPEFECFVKSFRVLTESLAYPDIFCEIPRASFTRALGVARGFAGMIKKIEDSDAVKFFTNEEDTSMLSTDVLSHSDEQIITSYHQQHHADLSALYPCIVVMCGSGFAVHKLMSRDGQGEMVGYSPRGGRTLLGLGSLLTGAQSFEELVELAAKGDSSNVDQFIKSLKGGDTDDFYAAFPDDALSFCFGHAFRKSIDDFKKEDLAAAVVQLVCCDLAQFALSMAQFATCKNVIFCGSILNHPTVVSTLAAGFLELSLFVPPSVSINGDKYPAPPWCDKLIGWSLTEKHVLQVQPRMHVCTLGPYLGAIGVWAIAAEAQAGDKAQQKDAVKKSDT